MTLNLGGMKQLFKHSKEFNTGGGEVRKGMGTFLVALDGSGDFDNIQEAINALPAGGGVVYIKEGTYTITSTITINKANIALVGAGKSTIIQNSGNITSLSASNFTGLNINKIYFKGSGLVSDNNKGIYFSGCHNSTISECWVTDYDYSGIYLYTSNYITVSSCNFSNNRTRGLLVDNAAYSAFVGNILHEEDGISFHMSTVNDCTISSNVIANNKSYGIRLEFSNRNIVSNNIAFTNAGTYDGILICNDSNYNILSGNVCHNNDRYGISIVHANCDKNIIIGNHCLGNGTAQINDAGTNTQISHNITA